MLQPIFVARPPDVLLCDDYFNGEVAHNVVTCLEDGFEKQKLMAVN